MALLSACWLVIENIVIQDGFLKWHYMKLYMHPLVLFLCQLLLLLHLFLLWLLPPFQAFYKAFLSLFFNFSKLFSSFIRIIMVQKESRCNIESRQENNNTLVNYKISRNIQSPVPAFSFSFKHQVDSQLKVLLALNLEEEEEEDVFFYECDQEDVVDQRLDAMEGEEEEQEEDTDIVDAVNVEKSCEFELHARPIDQGDESSLVNNDEEEEEEEEAEDIENFDVENGIYIESMDLELQDSIVMKNQTHEEVEDDEERDEVYRQYCKRMRWYDILSRDRAYGLSVIMKKQGTASRLSVWGTTAEKRLKQSIQKDLELAYVAQSCLSWEALQHQYYTVLEDSKTADSRGGLYDDDDIPREFQKFQILLERFLEDERCQGERVLCFVQTRLEFLSFFQVPRLSGSYNREGPGEVEKERKDKQALKAIEKCIVVFYDFVKLDIKRLMVWERLKISFVSSPLMELEDPRDFKLFLELKNLLQKKEQLLKGMQGNKKKMWSKKKPCNMEEDEIERDEKLMLLRFLVIDLKLVSRVLRMSLVSSSHLKWCQDKLNDIHFNGGKISRTSSLVLFPSS